MRIIKLPSLKKANPKKRGPKMAKKRRSAKKRVVISNPKKSRRRRNPVKIYRRRRNPAALSGKGIMEMIKPIGLGVLGYIAISKAISFIPLPENTFKPYIKIGAGVAVSYLGRKYTILKWGGIAYATLTAINQVLAQFPQLSAEDELLGYDENQMLGSQVNFGSQVEFSGEGATSEDMNYTFNGF